MRLGALFLTPAVLTAQAVLPWKLAPELPWEATLPGDLPDLLPPEPGPSAQTPGCLVSLTEDGSLRFIDDRGQVSLRLGLSGRPVRIMRDAGTPMKLEDFPFRFPKTTPLTKGLASMPLAGSDFRPMLKGLLWIVDDSQRRITLVHPATQRVVYLPLPPGEDWLPIFYPDRFEVRENTIPSEERRERACWSIPWLLLIPQLLELAKPPLEPSRGGALKPFPSD